MNNIKIRYTFRHKGSGNIEMKWYSIGQLEERAAAKLSPVFSDEYELISRDLYTGLKDINGREIYKGDVYHQGDPNILYVVEYKGASFVGKQIGSSSYAGLEHWKGRIEVIGDVYRNPDLLEAAE
ncbi:YopX family protein [Bacillus sonorensis]|uniref:YopX family protein n=1 Tax=Bacillus sonorensis TaxID=119858 RepID=UPI00227EF564|nr:YopX family protein [Bacillus sonorensis]MCY8035608.1 YopX family protein [Bacillus sonorensis]MCY8565262.1 YopX family protein [Bacillus sonorensis]